MTSTATAGTMPAPYRTPPVATWGVNFQPALALDQFAEIHELVGGTGICRWRQMFYGAHLPGAWNTVEHVVVTPGGSCGEHVHGKTEEIYYVLQGTAEMRIGGIRRAVRAGDLITAPIGTVHGIANDARADMHFLVVEVYPGSEAPREFTHVSMTGLLRDVPAGYRGSPDDGIRAYRIDLAPYFSGPWGSFTEMEIPPGGRIATERTRDAEVLFIVAGTSQITVRDAAYDAAPGAGLSVPLGAGYAVSNPSPEQDLRLVCATVRV